MKIDIFAHILPERYLKEYRKKNPAVMEWVEVKNPAVTDINVRLRLMDRYPDVLHVLTIAQPPLEILVKPDEAAELAGIANEELAELLAKYPDKFIAAAGCLPLNDMDAALEEADRAITTFGLNGVQIYSGVKHGTINHPNFRVLCGKMAGYDLPIWMHPCSDEKLDEPLFGWPFATAEGMWRIVSAGIFNDFPDIKFITHHCGSLVPYFEKRIKWLGPLLLGPGNPIRKPEDHFRKFYNDTALYGNTSALMCGLGFFGVDHVLFGTDAPLGPPLGLTLETIASVERMEISEADKQKIFTQNAIDLLRIAV